MIQTAELGLICLSSVFADRFDNRVSLLRGGFGKGVRDLSSPSPSPSHQGREINMLILSYLYPSLYLLFIKFLTLPCKVLSTASSITKFRIDKPFRNAIVIKVY